MEWMFELVGAAVCGLSSVAVVCALLVLAINQILRLTGTTKLILGWYADTLRSKGRIITKKPQP